MRFSDFPMAAPAWQQIVGLKEAPCDLVQVDALLQEAARHNSSAGGELNGKRWGMKD